MVRKAIVSPVSSHREVKAIIEEALEGVDGPENCPICNEPVQNVRTVNRGSWDPREAENKVCFKAKGNKQIVLYIHETIELDDPVSIEIE